MMPAMAGIAVGDSGPGVPTDQVDQVFTAFYSAREDGAGMGMGLAICRSVVEAHHGRIELTRDPLLGGACFTMWLARTAEGGPPPSTAQDQLLEPHA
jgi:two-component system, LuxR family, sensor histidine kinase DctS